MFENIGRKIRILAQVVFWVGVIGSCVAGLVVLVKMESAIGLLIMLGGGATALISGWLAYGFGELIDKTTEIAQNANTLPKIQTAVERKSNNAVGDNNQSNNKSVKTVPSATEQSNNKSVKTVPSATEQSNNKSGVYVVSQEPSLEKWLAEGIISEEEYQKIKAATK